MTRFATCWPTSTSSSGDVSLRDGWSWNCIILTGHGIQYYLVFYCYAEGSHSVWHACIPSVEDLCLLEYIYITKLYGVVYMMKGFEAAWVGQDARLLQSL